jgi:SAM-dependent methyltransferase
MTLRTLMALISSGQVPLLLGVTQWLAKPLYRASFLSAAASHGVLALLSSSPRSKVDIASALAPQMTDDAALEAWLQLGVRLGELEHTSKGYALKSGLAKRLADPRNDAVAAALEEVVRYHRDVLLEAPALFKSGRRLSLDDQDGRLIARSTRIIEPFVREAIDWGLGDSQRQARSLRLLEVGCGTGVYVKYAMSRNPWLTAVALELQQEVADGARRNLQEWQLDGRTEVVHGDVRDTQFGPEFDFVTLHNNIYYFPIDQRLALLRRVRGFLQKDGEILVTTACQGGNLGLEVLNLWFTSANCGGRLPADGEMVELLRAAGFDDVQARRLIPGDSYFAFRGVNRAVASA